MKISTLIAFFSKKRKMKKDIENKNRIEVKGDDKVVIQNSEDSNITIIKDGKKMVF